jgi:acetyl-CoA carboxylase, biotin carboxylase subunit
LQYDLRPRLFNKILIANRGEIALRVIRAARQLGIGTVAVYSEADRLSPHVLAADEAYAIGPAPSAESYLRIDRLVEAALRAGAEAVHPGYGFLSERAPFIRAVREAGLVFIGPSPEAVDAMGDKTAARRLVSRAGVPIVPGLDSALSDAGAAREAAEQIGYPVLLKAAAGGGGKGMRIVESEREIEAAFAAAGSEALSAFGDGSVYLERFLEGPRHIEVQILADRAGTTLHLGERECSIQRRHQKMIEEAPSPAVTEELRQRIGDTAVAAAKAAGYEGAGTVEFLFQDGEFYFLEMNTRIQVEHPITELVTGIDLVHWQIRIAAGESLPFGQDQIELAGHAIECRITSEDPSNDFLPSIGRIEHLEIPTGPGVRWDGGITLGSTVGLHYDPMLAKLIVHAADRELAIEQMKVALEELRIIGVETTVPFHLRVMNEPDFIAGRVDIRYLESHYEQMTSSSSTDAELRVIALAAAMLEHDARASASPAAVAGDRQVSSAWKRSRSWSGR